MEPPEPTRLGEVTWLEPFPDALLEGAIGAPDGVRHATGVFVLTLAGDQISALARFESSVLPWFGLPRSLPPR